MTLSKLTGGSGQSEPNAEKWDSPCLQSTSSSASASSAHSPQLSPLNDQSIVHLFLPLSLSLVFPLEGFSARNLGLPLQSLSQPGNVRTAAFSLPSSRPQSHALPPPSHHLTRVLQSLSALKLSIPLQLQTSQIMNRQ